MEEKSFFKTKEGGLTIAFLVIIAGFVIVMLGLGMENPILYGAGFFLMAAAMLYSPLKEKVFGRKRS